MGPHGPQFFFRLLPPVLFSAFGQMLILKAFCHGQPRYILKAALYAFESDIVNVTNPFYVTNTFYLIPFTFCLIPFTLFIYFWAAASAGGLFYLIPFTL